MPQSCQDNCSLPRDFQDSALGLKIARAANGSLVLAYSADIGHNRGGSGLAVSLSHDGGHSFSDTGLLCYFPDDDERYRDCGNMALGVARDGAVILLAMAFYGHERNTIVGWRSEDNGKTWSRTDTTALKKEIEDDSMRDEENHRAQIIKLDRFEDIDQNRKLSGSIMGIPVRT